uniref:Uncharacterized protein n=1 Tax=Peronospora matthiolae TaxID=2874970 RepID=A0AAV1U5Q1_9STRA
MIVAQKRDQLLTKVSTTGTTGHYETRPPASQAATRPRFNMRIYTTELLAAVAFIESLSRYSASGSKTLRPDLHSSDRPKDRVGDASDDGMSQSDDEANGEDRTGTRDVHSLLALFGRAQKRTYDHEIPDFDAQGWDRFVLGTAEDQVHDQIIPTLAAEDWDQLRHAHYAPERLESSGTVATPVLDLPSLAEKEQAPVVASQSEADSTKVNEHSPGVAPRLEADSTRVNEHSPGVASRLEVDSTRINELLIADATQLEVKWAGFGKRMRETEHALAVAPLPNDKRTSIIEQLQQQTDKNLLSPDQWNSLKKGKKTQDWTAEQLMQDLVEVYCAKANGLTKLASALRKAKVAGRNDGEIFTALEAAMLESWKNRGITFDRSIDLLELPKLAEEKDMTVNKLRLLYRYKFVSLGSQPGRGQNVYRHLLKKLNSKDDEKYLRTIAQAGEESTIAKGMLMYYAISKRRMSSATMIERMRAAQISKIMIRCLPSKAQWVAQAQKRTTARFDGLTLRLRWTRRWKKTRLKLLTRLW